MIYQGSVFQNLDIELLDESKKIKDFSKTIIRKTNLVDEWTTRHCAKHEFSKRRRPAR